MTKIYTKTGDEGETGLFGGPRVRKDSVRIEAYGAVDELNAVLGLAHTASLPEDAARLVVRLQRELFDLGAELASPDPHGMGLPVFGGERIASLESAIDQHEATLAPLKQFILPGGDRGAAWLHLARTVCRRAERRVATLAAAEALSPYPLVYLNRLSDLLFVLARSVNQAAGVADQPWRQGEAE